METWIGGPRSRRELARLCGLATAPGGPWSLESVRAEPGGRLVLRLAAGACAATVVAKPATTAGGFLRAGALDLCYEGAQAEGRVLELLRALGRRLRRARPERLRRLVVGDPRSARELPRAALPAAGAARQGAPSSQAQAVLRSPERAARPADAACLSDRLGGGEEGWRRFFCAREFERGFYWAHATGFQGRVLYFVHGDFDCTFMPPDLAFRGMSFLNFPPLHPHSPDAPVPRSVYEQWSSDLDERDAVLGGGSKLDAFVEAARRAPKPDAVMISWSCTPTVMGEDENAAARRCRGTLGCPVVVNSINFRMRESFSLFEELFAELKSRPEFAATAPDPRAANLVDCPPRFLAEELGPALAAAGARVNCRIFPEIDLRALSRYRAAACQIVPEHLLALPTIARALGGLELKTVSVPAPFGLAATRAYVRAAARPFGGESAAACALARRWRALSKRFEEPRGQARGRTLGFVCGAEDLPGLLRPGFVSGIPVARMIAELGFRARFLVYAPGGALPPGAEALARLPGFAEPPELRAFADRAGLERLLEAADLDAVYSDIFFDARLARAGKAQFSARDFSAGLGGALRSLTRLLAICRLPFYRRYGRLLA